MIPVVVKNCRIGEGRTKVIVPIVGVTQEEILRTAASFSGLSLDVVEWRMDWYEHGMDADKVIETAGRLQKVLGNVPLLSTFRTATEGGEKAIEPAAYAALLKKLCAARCTDMIDVEIFTGDLVVREIIDAAHDAGVVVVASNHDFKKTPAKAEILYRLRRMRDMGADIPKIAVMPRSKRDVLTLLTATEEMATDYADCPIITMAMGGMGVVSRLVGESLGSAMTFGSAGKASAPGQVDVQSLNGVLDVIHNSL